MSAMLAYWITSVFDRSTSALLLEAVSPLPKESLPKRLLLREI
jgi:hypothetical protein